MKPPAGPTLEDLLALFPPAADIRSSVLVSADDVPQPYHQLLVHEHHMTVTVEDHHGDLVDVRVLAVKHDDDTYGAKFFSPCTKPAGSCNSVPCTVHLQFCSEAVRAEILEQRLPLGRILIQHNVLRRIEPTAYLKIVPGPNLMKWFNLTQPTPAYGRLGLIHCDGHPAIEVLEVVTPE